MTDQERARQAAAVADLLQRRGEIDAEGVAGA